METNFETRFIELRSFFRKSLQKHEVKKGTIKPGYTEFISVEGLLAKTTIKQLVKCLFEQGKRRFIQEAGKNKGIESLNEEVENWISSEKTWFDATLPQAFQKETYGRPLFLPSIVVGPIEDPTKELKKIAPLKSRLELLDMVKEVFEEIYTPEEIALEIKILRQLKRSEAGLECFIDAPNPSVFHTIYAKLLQKGLIEADIDDFVKLFSGQVPDKKVIFESASFLQKLKLFLVKLGLRSNLRYSLESNFSPYIDFMNHKEKGDVAQQIANSSKNISKVSLKSMKIIFPEFQDIMN